MVVVALLVGRGDPFAFVAWSASGDARFHLLFVRDVLAEGGLHGQTFTYQPQYQEALTALLADTHGRGALAPGELLEHDLHILAQVSIAMTVTWTLATTALLLGFRRLEGRTSAVALAAASLLPLTGIALGIVLRDGFLPVLLLVPMLLATIALLGWLQVATEGPRVTWVVGVTAAALPVLAFTWTPFAVVAGCAALPPWWRSIRSSRGRTRTLRLALMAGGVVTSAAYTVVVLANSRDFVLINGSIAAPAPPTTLLVPLLVLLIAAGRWSAVRASAFRPYVAGTVATAVITIYTIQLQPAGVIWTTSRRRSRGSGRSWV